MLAVWADLRYTPAVSEPGPGRVPVRSPGRSRRGSGTVAGPTGAWGTRPGEVSHADACKGRKDTKQGSWRKAWDTSQGHLLQGEKVRPQELGLPTASVLALSFLQDHTPGNPYLCSLVPPLPRAWLNTVPNSCFKPF